ncbi:hypothetical protein KJJ19_09520 [Acinetobacter towneri]|nr:hypothetical protein [Acinetobacter towneri]NWJ92931.1 hypothetical protein [Acinetobacter sp. Swhac1]
MRRLSISTDSYYSALTSQRQRKYRNAKAQKSLSEDRLECWCQQKCIKEFLALHLQIQV